MKSAENQTRTSICHGEQMKKGKWSHWALTKARRFQKRRERDGESEERSPNQPSVTNLYSLRRWRTLIWLDVWHLCLPSTTVCVCVCRCLYTCRWTMWAVILPLMFLQFSETENVLLQLNQRSAAWLLAAGGVYRVYNIKSLHISFSEMYYSGRGLVKNVS